MPFSAMIQSLNVTQDGVITFCPELWFQLDWPSIFTAFPLPPTAPPFVMVNPIICNVVSVPSTISKSRLLPSPFKMVVAAPSLDFKTMFLGCPSLGPSVYLK